MGPGGWGGRWHGGEAEERVHSVGRRSLNHTASELMHHSKENQGPPVRAPAHLPRGWCPPHTECCARSARVGLRGAPGGPAAAPSPFLLSCSAGWCVQVAGTVTGMIRISGSGWQWQGSRGRFEGEVEKQPPSPVLQRGLAAEDNLQVFAVELSRLSQGHDALSVAGELLDVHFLGDRGRG